MGPPRWWAHGDVDELVVELTLEGRRWRQGELTMGEELKVVVSCTEAGWTAVAIGEALGLSRRAVVRRRQWAGVSQPVGGNSKAHLVSTRMGRYARG